MTALDLQDRLLQRLDEVRRLCPEMRIGQFLATVEMLGKDDTGRSLWDIEDEELATAVERFAQNLSRRSGA
jgi:hypothetical protein